MEHWSWGCNGTGLSTGFTDGISRGALLICVDAVSRKILENFESLSQFEEKLDVRPEYVKIGKAYSGKRIETAFFNCT